MMTFRRWHHRDVWWRHGGVMVTLWSRYSDVFATLWVTLTVVDVKLTFIVKFCFNLFLGKGYETSSSSFLFSLQSSDGSRPLKASVYRNERRAVYRYPSYGPTFGGGYDLHICDKPNTSCKSYANLGNTYQIPEEYALCKAKQTKSLLARSAKFTPTEIEVFY